MCVCVCVRGDLIYKADPGGAGLAEPGEGLMAVHRPPGRPLVSEAPRGDRLGFFALVPSSHFTDGEAGPRQGG